MQDSNAPLPADHAFVLQLEESRNHRRPPHEGRVEHLCSGRAVRFDSEAELWAFVDATLAEITKRSPATKRFAERREENR